MVRCREMGPEPVPLYRPELEAERTRIEEATRAFLAKGGEIQQVGYQMSNQAPLFVIDPKRTPVYAYLFQTEATPMSAPPKPSVPAEPEPAQAPVKAKLNGLAARALVHASLGASPRETARVLGISEKAVRQLARDFHITFKRQR